MIISQVSYRTNGPLVRISFLVTKLVCFDFGYIKFEMLWYGQGGKNGPAYSFPTMNTNL